jgi:spore germination cell wall hydrolase CwlJ-like protein
MINSLLCVALAIYFEAQSEPALGQIAVAQVIYNRLEDSRYPDTACDVVKQGHYQNDKPIRNQCQFSFYCDGKSDQPDITSLAWYSAQRVAQAVYEGRSAPVVGDATHYHARWVHPDWASSGYVVATVNDHVFYKDVK